MRQYSAVLRIRDAREILVIALLMRIPMWAAAIALTLHVVGPLHRNYAAAGVVTAGATIAAAISGPWRGRRLDQIGLRRTMLPSMVVILAVYAVAPWVGYWPLMVLVALAALFMIPSFSIVRQVLIRAVDLDQRTTALTLDGVLTEISFMIGPALGVWLCALVGTGWTMLICEYTAVLMATILYVQNPVLVRDDEQTEDPAKSIRAWMTPLAMVILAVAAVATFVLSGTDLGIVAAMRSWDSASAIGWMLAIWGLGSAIGGLVYGVLPFRISPFTLVGLLGLTSIPVALADGPVLFAVLLFVTGLFCAPTITATIDQLSRVVPAGNRGEAMGYHGSALMAGSAVGGPALGIAIDAGGWEAAFIVAGVIGAVMAAVGFGALALRRRTPVHAGDAS